ncbi:DNA/RNA polymerase [Thelephora ganbajun]|uniref:DNA/RNA polymerase n=1 Tax=Thelephora ganbajun TaxID=370292 RepID=A0ACB6ZN05_THEGA|nr:DNA/RNA polymerase [Thelephora ganbajun]
MRIHNLCYTALLDKSTVGRLGLVKDTDYIQTPTMVCIGLFVEQSKRCGLSPTILDDFISTRKRAKADLREETDPFKKVVLDGRQLTLKISASSIYGFTGATTRKLPCLAISSSVTAYTMIERTRQEVEAYYTIDNGQEHNAEVMYGDPDSVMVKFEPTDLKTVMRLGGEAADYFEEIYFPYNCRLASTVIETCSHKILIDRNVASELLQNKVDMSQLTDYTGRQAHVGLAARMEQRDAGSAPALGDRAAYAIIKGYKENNIPIDTKYCLDNQLTKPLVRILKPILGEKTSPLCGLMKFVVKTRTCLGCKTTLKPTNSLVAELQMRFAKLWTQCQRFQGSLHQDALYTSKDYPIFYMRKEAQKDAGDPNGSWSGRTILIH